MKAKKIKFYLVKLLITSFAVLFTAWMLQKGIHIEEPRILTAIIVGVTLILLNTFLKPLLIRLTIPLTVFSFGFFLLVINAIVIELIDFMLPGFTVDSFFWAMLYGAIVSFITSLIELFSNVRIVRYHQQDMYRDRNDDNDDDFTPYEEV